MYIPSINRFDDRDEIIAFMKRFSFATVVSSCEGRPLATHLPFLVDESGDDIVLTSHFAKANDHWKHIQDSEALVIFSEPHAYISPAHYQNEQNVPTWNYLSVHAYGPAEWVTDEGEVFKILENTIDYYEAAYRQQWEKLTEKYKQGMAQGIVAFRIRVSELQAKKKLSQNRTPEERQNIINGLSQSPYTHEQSIADYMRKNENEKGAKAR